MGCMGCMDFHVRLYPIWFNTNSNSVGEIYDTIGFYFRTASVVYLSFYLSLAFTFGPSFYLSVCAWSCTYKPMLRFDDLYY